MRRALATTAVALLGLLALAPTAGAAFDLLPPEVRSEAQGGGEELRAGAHPFALTTEIAVQTEIDPDTGKPVPTGEVKDMVIDFPPGLVGNPTAVEQCSTPDFLAGKNGECSNDAAVGLAEVEFGEPGKITTVPVYNLEPSPGSAAKVGFIVEDRAPVTIDIGLNPESPNNVVANSTNVSQAVFFYRAEVEVWGTPAADVHDAERGRCGLEVGAPPGPCPFEGPEEVAFLTLPSSCDAPLDFDFRVNSWGEQGNFDEETAAAGAIEKCDELEFEPEVAAAPTTTQTSSPSGLDFSIGFDDAGLVEPTGRAQATIKKAVVTLPPGMTLNPGAAEGLDSCSQAAFEAESLQGLKTGPRCPAASKVGEVEVVTPLLEEVQTGSIYVATPYQNPFGTLLALYMVIREPELGVLVKLPGKVIADPATGQLTTTFGEAPYTVPQVPFSDFRFQFRSGPRAPLTTPPGCGPHQITAVFTPSSGQPAIAKTTSFATTSGPGGAPCPGSLPFAPSFEAGSQVSTAGAFSPYYMRLAKAAGQQDLTSLSAILPPGLTAKIAGVGRCSQAALAAAATRKGVEELALPSCPAGSRIGQITSGAGSGSALTYVPGSLYLAGPYGSSPLSVAAVVPAVAGPFDLGTVVVQQGLDLNPTTGIAEVKGAPASIPRFLAGIPLSLRDVRIAVDRPGFTLNPTDCEPLATHATLQGTTSQAQAQSRYQASGCRALKFKPKLVISMKGKTKRTGNPAVTATMTPRPGDANIAGATVLLPPTMFIDNAHINNPCTRVQFAVEQCPKGSVLGTAVAHTPLLEEPLKGNVYFRSNGGERELPDLVADLRGLFRITLVGFVDSKNGRTRTRFLGVPDAPVSKFTLKLAGGKRGLLENSVNICAKKQIAKVVLGAQNGRRLAKDQAIRVKCGKGGKGKGKGKGGGGKG